MGEESRRLIDECNDGFELLSQPSDCVDDEAATSLSLPPIYTQLVCNTPQVGFDATPPCTDSTWDLPPFELPFDDEICPRDRDNNDLDTLFSEVEYPFDTEISPRELERYLDFITPLSDRGSTYVQTSIYPTEEDPLSTHTEPLSTFTGPFPTQAGPSNAGVCPPTSQTSPSLIQSTPFTTHTDPCETQTLPNFQLDALSTQVGKIPSEMGARNISQTSPTNDNKGLASSPMTDQSLPMASTLHQTEAQCKECNKVFSRKFALKRHSQTVHKDDPTFYQCDRCGKHFTRRDGLKVHIENQHSISKAEVQCKECNKVFSSKYILKRHSQTVHKGDSNCYQCDRCGKRFTRRDYLKVHIENQHSISIPEMNEVQCKQCKKVFSTKYCLKRHSRTAHKEDANIYRCDQCGERFLQRYNLLVHIKKQHSIRKPDYTCSKCGKTFASATIRERHSQFNCPSVREQPLLDTADESAASAMEPGPSTALFRKPSNLVNRTFGDLFLNRVKAFGSRSHVLKGRHSI